MHILNTTKTIRCSHVKASTDIRYIRSLPMARWSYLKSTLYLIFLKDTVQSLFCHSSKMGHILQCYYYITYSVLFRYFLYFQYFIEAGKYCLFSWIMSKHKLHKNDCNIVNHVDIKYFINLPKITPNVQQKDFCLSYL